MVNLGFLPSATRAPSPELSYVRLFEDDSIGWQFKGQYAVWTGASHAARGRYRLLERYGNRVGAIEYADGSAVLHRIDAGRPFHIEGLMRYWLTFDSDAMWLDTPHPSGRYALLAIGGAEGKPGQAVLDWTCPSCGMAMAQHVLKVRQTAFSEFLAHAESLAEAFQAHRESQRCSHCAAVHPPLDAMRRLADEVKN